ncbi:class I glutamine amidotransferase-like protein [Backusella circina FSU 941]|nr:class I glutamine amidotransferase-like protein [Backusella circina FSU 941]
MPEVLAKHGDYTAQFPRIFNRALPQGVTIEWDFFDVVSAQEYPTNHLDYDAIVLTGSKYDAHAEDAWTLKLIAFLKKVRETKQVKMIGICYGHQVLLRALGGVTGRSGKEWERINQFHHDAVSVLPPGFQNLAFTPNNTAHQATVSDDRQCITIQGHPEFNRDTVTIMIESRKALGIIPPDVADQSLAILKEADEAMDDVWLVEKFIELVLN